MQNFQLFLREMQAYHPANDIEFVPDLIVDLVSAFAKKRRRKIHSFAIVPSLVEAMAEMVEHDFDSRWGLNDARHGSRVDRLFTPTEQRWPWWAPERKALWRSVHKSLYDHTTRLCVSQLRSSPKYHRTFPHLFEPVLPASLLAPQDVSMRSAMLCGLGWIIPTEDTMLIVPKPRYAFLNRDADPLVLHDDNKRAAIEWDGFGFFFLHGHQFGGEEYAKIVLRRMGAREALKIPNGDKRSVALSMLGAQQLIQELGAELIDVGRRGTRLYRVRDVPIMRQWNYFMHMRDASHPEREFIEWVPPEVGQHGNAELCQANAFGITLEEWLSIEQEG